MSIGKKEKKENVHRNIYINNYFKCKWIKRSNQKTQTPEWIQEQDPYMCCLQETLIRPRDTYRLRGWKKTFHSNSYVR